MNFEANEYGLYDIAGNVNERCTDWYDENYYNNLLKDVYYLVLPNR